MATYTLPDLPYDYGALEPHISGKIMRLHHDKPHRAYVTGANDALDALADQVKRDFGDVSRFRAELISAAATIMGSGWAALTWDPLSKRLLTAQIHDHQNEITQGGVPILVLDAWEHAYYLQYGPDKKTYFDAIWNVWNWADAGRRFESVRGIGLALRQAA